MRSKAYYIDTEIMRYMIPQLHKQYIVELTLKYFKIMRFSTSLNAEPTYKLNYICAYVSYLEELNVL